MAEKQCWAGFTLGTPASYMIKVRGWLDDSWARQLGMSLSHISARDGVPLTLLAGELVDQAALFGVLNGLYGLGFPLLSVESSPLETTHDTATAASNHKSQNHKEPDEA